MRIFRKKSPKNKYNGSSLENILLEPMSKLKPQRLDNDMFKAMLSLGLMSDEQAHEVYTSIKNDHWQMEAIEKRISKTFTCSIGVKILIALFQLLKGNIGQMTIYILYLQYWAKQNNHKLITFEDFMSDIFPLGFPSLDDIHPLYDAQKTPDGNLLDILETHKSIHF